MIEFHTGLSKNNFLKSTESLSIVNLHTVINLSQTGLRKFERGVLQELLGSGNTLVIGFNSLINLRLEVTLVASSGLHHPPHVLPNLASDSQNVSR